MWETIKNDPVLKTVVIILLGVLGFGFAFNIMFGPQNNGMEHGMGGGYGFGVAGILVLLLKILLFISVIGAIVGVFMYIRQNYSKQITEKIGAFKTGEKRSIDCPKCSTKVSEAFEYCPGCGVKLKVECIKCSAELKAEWKCCPNCGADKV